MAPLAPTISTRMCSSCDSRSIHGTNESASHHFDAHRGPPCDPLQAQVCAPPRPSAIRMEDEARGLERQPASGAKTGATAGGRADFGVALLTYVPVNEPPCGHIAVSAVTRP